MPETTDTNENSHTGDDWDVTCDRFVACLDILGFKDKGRIQLANATRALMRLELV